MINILSKIPLFKLSRRFGLPRMLPINLTVALTNRCNSRCMTCNVYEKEVEELTLEEYEEIFRSIGKTPYWITFSGGEPFLKRDIVDICTSAYRNCKPRIINIPTNGILTDKIEKGVKAIVEDCPGATIIINLSIDGIGDRHDEIRGVKGCFEKAMETYKILRGMRYKNLTVGIHTVISRFNVKEIPQLYEWVQRLKPDSYITEIAEERVELGTVGSGITPSLEDYEEAIDFISNKMRHQELKGISRLTRAFRAQYYKMVKRILKEGREVIPCYAAIASCQIAPNGEVWDCCIKAEGMGNLREAGYDFKKVWFSDRAKRLREEIKRRRCFCPLANASYTNILFSIKTLAAIAVNPSIPPPFKKRGKGGI